MESLTPFIRHELEDAPGPSGPPEETSSVVSPPLGAEPVSRPSQNRQNRAAAPSSRRRSRTARMCRSRRRKSRSPVRTVASP